MLTKMNPITAESKYSCTVCNFKTNDHNDYKRHLVTKKHLATIEKKVENDNDGDVDVLSGNPIRLIIQDEKHVFACNKCYHIYKHQSSLSKHKKTCGIVTTKTSKKQLPDLEQTIETLKNQLKEQKEMYESQLSKQYESQLSKQYESQLSKQKTMYENQLSQLSEQLEKSRQHVFELALAQTKSIQHVQTIERESPHAKSPFNLEKYLNETCKDAPNLDEFSLDCIKQIDARDILEWFSIHKFEKAICLVLKELFKTIPQVNRPFQVIDKKRKILKIKVDDEWIEQTDGDNKILNNWIVNKLFMKTLLKTVSTEYQSNPNLNKNEKIVQQYFATLDKFMFPDDFETKGKLNHVLIKICEICTIEKR